MNSQPDLNIFKLLTENPEFMQKAISIASSLASSGILSGQLGLQGNASQTHQGSSGYPQSQQHSPNSNSDSREINSPSPDILQGLDLSRLFSQAGESTPHENSSRQSSSPASQRDESSVSSAVGQHSFAKASHAERIRLLEAMRPFVPTQRREKLDFIIRLMGLIEVADKLGLKNIIGGR